MLLPTSTSNRSTRFASSNSWRRKVSTKFLIVLCFYSSFMLIWVGMGRWSGRSSWFADNNNTSLTSLIDLDCLRALQARHPCRGPVKVATTWHESGTFEQRNAEYFDVTHELERPTNRNYVLFVPLGRDSNEEYMRRVIPDSDNFQLSEVNFTDGRSFWMNVPVNIAKFERHWTNAHFLDCLGLQMNRTDTTQVLSLNETKQEFAKFRVLVDKLNGTAFLFAGTLLGWYRECTVISHTTDADFGIHALEISTPIVERIKFAYQMIHKLGTLNDSLELTFMLGNVRTDLFVVYPLNNTNSYCTVVDFKTRRTLMAVYPRVSEICAGDLLGDLVYVPCNVEEILQTDYGPNWRKDRPSDDYSYVDAPNLILFMKHTAEELANRVVFYDQKGKVVS